MGRASVRAPAATGSGEAAARTVGRAQVRAAIPTSPAPAGPVSAVPVSPGPARGRARVNRPVDPAAAARKKKRRRRQLIVAVLAALVLLISGGAVVGGVYYYTDVPLPEQKVLPESTNIYYSDGSTAMAGLGDYKRKLVSINDIPQHVQDAVISAEDRTFKDNKGIDYKGIVRAAWRNLTGQSSEGASTITQQYARDVADLTKSRSYSRKAKEIVIAMKLDKEYKKEKILELYLNSIYFGRGAYGIDAAAQAYFGKPVKEITPEQGGVLAAVIKDPNELDPAKNKDAAVNRWNYVMSGMGELGFLDKAKAAAMKYPEVKKVDPKDRAQWGLTDPTGFVVQHVREELERKKITDLSGGGYKITTTIDPAMQQALAAQTNKAAGAKHWAGIADNVTAAAVVVQPGTGRVLAYYGGPDGSGSDYAGVYKNVDNGEVEGYGFHPPGSSWKAFDLAAALRDGYAIDSWWDCTSPRRFGGREIRNSGNANGGTCTLDTATVKSLNTPFYAITEKVGVKKVLQAAKDAGVRWIKDGENKNWDLTKTPVDEVAKHFDPIMGIGQFPTTVLDMAAGFATFANMGGAAETHFVDKVEKNGKVVYQAPKTVKVQFAKEQMADMASVLAKVPGGKQPNNGRKWAEKTGTWELNSGTDDNAHTYAAGYTPEISLAVWVGNKEKQLALKYKGRNMFGADLATDIWVAFANQALADTKVYPIRKDFPPKALNVGDSNKGERPSPPPSASPGATPGPGGGNPCAVIPVLCTPGTGGQNPNPTPTRRR